MLTRLKGFLAHNRHAYVWSRRAYGIARYLARRPHEADFAAFAQFRDRQGLFLDIGANTGQSAMSFRIFHRTAPIFSIEPNRFHETDLKIVRRLLRNFDYRICGAGDANRTDTLYVPVYNGLPLTGEASLDPELARDSYWVQQQTGGAHPERLEVRAVPIEIRRLDELELAPSFVKIDVEGAELPALRGLADTIRKHQPIVLVERSPRHDEVDGFLAELGYRSFVYDAAADRLVPYVEQAAQNLFYLSRADSSAPIT